MSKRLMTAMALAVGLTSSAAVWAADQTNDTGDTGTKTMPSKVPAATGTGGAMGTGGTSGTGDTGTSNETGGHKHKHKKGHGTGGTAGGTESM